MILLTPYLLFFVYFEVLKAKIVEKYPKNQWKRNRDNSIYPDKFINTYFTYP